jgi:hypothetical protein
MAVDEQHLRVRRSLEEKLGVEEASYLMDRPVGGWSELVTNHTLDLKFAALDERFRVIDERFRVIDERFVALEKRMDARFETVDARFESLRHELVGHIDKRFGELAWKVLTAVIAGMAVMATIFAGVTAGLVLLLGP